MEKLVFNYNESDGCSYHIPQSISFEYESKAKAENDFFELAYEQLKNYLNQTGIWYNGIEFFQGYSIGFVVTDFFKRDPQKEKLMNYENIDSWDYIPPQILTLEEWFDANCGKIHQKVFDKEK